MIWNNCFGGNSDEEGSSITQTIDDGYIITGYTDSNDGDVTNLHGFGRDFWIVKTNSVGNLQWQKCFGGFNFDEATKIIQTSDSGYFVIGESESNDGDVHGNHGAYDIWAVKLNSNGIKQWAKCYGGSIWDNLSTCVQTKDGGYLIAGQTSSYNGDVTGQHNAASSDVWVFKIDSIGSIQWQRCYGGISSEAPYEIIFSNDGGYYIAAGTSSSDGDVSNYLGGGDFWLLKIDSIGTLEWNKCYGGAYYEELFAACGTSDGGIAMAGATNLDGGMVSGTHGSLDMWVVKVDSLGNLNWAKALGGTNDDVAKSIIESPDGGLVIAGYSKSVNGDVTSNHGDKDYWIVKLAPLGLSVSEVENSLMELAIFQNNNQLNLRFFSKKNETAQLCLYDVTGKKVFEKNISVNEGVNYNSVNCTGFSRGMYFVKVDGKKGALGGKVIIQSEP